MKYSIHICNTRWSKNRDSIPSTGKNFSLVHSVQTGSGSNPGSYPVGTGGSFLGGEVAGHEVDHSHPPSAEDKNSWIHTCTSLRVIVFVWLLFPRCTHVKIWGIRNISVSFSSAKATSERQAHEETALRRSFKGRDTELCGQEVANHVTAWLMSQSPLNSMKS